MYSYISDTNTIQLNQIHLLYILSPFNKKIKTFKFWQMLYLLTPFLSNPTYITLVSISPIIFFFIQCFLLFILNPNHLPLITSFRYSITLHSEHYYCFYLVTLNLYWASILIYCYCCSNLQLLILVFLICFFFFFINK